MFKPSLVAAFLIGSVCVFAKAEGQALPDSQQPPLKTLETSLSNLDSSQLLGVQPAIHLEETPAIGGSAATLTSAQETSDLKVASPYDLPASSGKSGERPIISPTPILEILAAGLLFVGSLVILFRHVAAVIKR